MKEMLMILCTIYDMAVSAVKLSTCEIEGCLSSGNKIERMPFLSCGIRVISYPQAVKSVLTLPRLGRTSPNMSHLHFHQPLQMKENSGKICAIIFLAFLVMYRIYNFHSKSRVNLWSNKLLCPEDAFKD